MADQDNELRDFTQETLRQIKEGKGKNGLYGGEVHFDIAIGKKMVTEGKVGVGVLSIIKAGAEGKGEHTTENVSKIGFRIILHEDDSENDYRDFVPEDDVIGV
jgi:hypothetical protein